MAWEKRGNRTYYYRVQRSGEKVRKIYLGAGPVGRLAALDDETERAEQQAAREQWELDLLRTEAAEVAAHGYERQCRLLLEAVLLASGFRRQTRHQWRAWREGRRVIAGAGG